jgi:biotin operon repressor
MALQDFLGKTVEIRIIDFLSQNRAFTYNQTELSECLGISRTSVNQKLPELIFNGIVEVKEKQGNANYYQLANNPLVKKLVGSMFENGLIVSEYNQEPNVVISSIKQEVGSIVYSEKCECFAYPEKAEISDIPTYAPFFEDDASLDVDLVYNRQYKEEFCQINTWKQLSSVCPSSAVSA